jgi:hypothetical protein
MKAIARIKTDPTKRANLFFMNRSFHQAKPKASVIVSGKHLPRYEINIQARKSSVKKTDPKMRERPAHASERRLGSRLEGNRFAVDGLVPMSATDLLQRGKYSLRFLGADFRIEIPICYPG